MSRFSIIEANTIQDEVGIETRNLDPDARDGYKLRDEQDCKLSKVQMFILVMI